MVLKSFGQMALIVTLSVAFTSCSGKQLTESDVQCYLPLKSTRVVDKLEEYISELYLIPMVSDSVCLANVRKMIIGNSSYYVLSGGIVFAVSFDGTQIEKIGNVGRGPGEYLSIKDFAINVSGTQIWCLDVFNTLLKYDINGYKYLSRIENGKNIGYAEAIIPLKNDSYALYVPNPSITKLSGLPQDFKCLKFYDSEGKPCLESMLWSDFNIETSFSVPSSNTGVLISVLSPESPSPSIVYARGEECSRVFFDFGDKNVPYRFAFKKGSNPMEMIGEIFELDYYKLISSVFILSDAYYFRAYGKDSSLWNFLLPMDGSEGIRWESKGAMTPPISALGSDGEYLYFTYDDYGLNANEEDPLKVAIQKKFGMPEVSNGSYIIKVMLHE